MSDVVACPKCGSKSLTHDGKPWCATYGCHTTRPVTMPSSVNIYRASGMLAAASAVTMYGEGRRERGQISARTMRELERVADHLRDLAVATRDRKQ